MITSLANSKIKRLVQLKNKPGLRKEAGVFIAEGSRMFLELPEELTLELYATEEFWNSQKNETAVKRIKQFSDRCEIVSGEVFEKISDTVTPQGVLAVVKQLQYSLKDLLKADKPLILMAEDLQDPGNLGTMFRTAEAAGADGIIMNSGTVDLYNPKTVRSTMGSVFRMPFLYVNSMKETIDILQRHNISVYAAALHHSVSYTEVDYKRGCAVLVGNEGRGLKRETEEAASQAVSIPMQGRVESLNASISAAVILYEAARQRSGIG